MKGMSAHTRYVRQSPRKVRLIADLIRGLDVSVALAQLAYTVKAARLPVEKTLRSAVANAENNFQKHRDALFVKEIQINEGADLRRSRPRAFGRAAPILKHSCHILIILGEREGKKGEGKNGKNEVKSEKKVHPQVGSESHEHDHPHGTKDHAPLTPRDAPPKEIIDTSRTGRHETAQHANVKEHKKSKGFIKTIIQRKTGS